MLEKAQFPREKVCGDGLTPRATRQLIRLGIDTSERAGWLHNKGLRIYGGSTTPFELPWPELADFPSYGLVRPRSDFDDLLARNAVAAGAKLYELAATSPRRSSTTGPIGSSVSPPRTARSSARRWWSPPTATRPGSAWPWVWPSATTGRWAWRCAPTTRARRHLDDHLESWLELWDGTPGQSDLLPGYGWIFGMGDGTCNVGLGVLNTSSAFGKTDYKRPAASGGWTTPRRSGVSATRT